MCERVTLPDGLGVAIVCGVRRPRSRPCAYCGHPSDSLCDGPRRHHAGKTATCDRALCRRCRIHVPPNQDFCREHRVEAAAAAAQLRLFAEEGR